jgi:sterol desaturase/sphingolipid hydroxylase (fatty acid hydroxylase superfamily)
MLFITDDMAVRSANEWYYVLIPPYGAMLIFVVNAPIAAGLWLQGLPNVAALFLVTAVAYVVGYEWLHLSYHQPPDSFVGRLALVRILRRHHALHHDPRLMQRYNFNVTVPLWDLVRGTYVSDATRALTRSA